LKRSRATQTQQQETNTITQQAYNNVMSSTPSATRESQRLLEKASKSQEAKKDDVIPRKSNEKRDQRQEANEDPAPEQQQQKDTNQITNTATASTDTSDSTNTSPASLTATQRPEKKKGKEQQGSASNTRKKSGGRFSKKESREMGKGTEPYSFHGNHPALSGSESDAVIHLLGETDDEQPTVSDVLMRITMEDYTATNIDDVGVATRNQWIRHHTIQGRRTVSIPAKYQNSNLGKAESESSNRVNLRKYKESKWCQEKFGESPSFSFDLLGLIHRSR
jgi:hypothetical protein